MRILIQRVKRAHVTVKGKVIGRIGKGLVLFLGLKHGDSCHSISYFTKKIPSLRLFSDQEEKMNLSLKETEGSVLMISQFTLYGSVQKGRRPSFQKAFASFEAKPLYDRFVDEFRKELGEEKVETGCFGALMEVELIKRWACHLFTRIVLLNATLTFHKVFSYFFCSS